MRVVKRSESQFFGPVPGIPAVTLTLSVLLCIGALSNGSAAASVVARSLQRQGATVAERESVASLLSSLNEAARKLCRPQPGQAVVLTTRTDHLIRHIPTALRPVEMPERYDALKAVLPHLLNLPPPAATI